MITPQQFAHSLDSISSLVPDYGRHEILVKEFLATANAQQLAEGLRLTKLKNGADMGFVVEAYRVLNVRLQEEAARAIEKHIAHSEQLTRQTETLITEARNLTVLTETLTKQNTSIIGESKQIRYLTWALLIFTAGLLIRDCMKETHTVDVINNPVTVTNVPVYIVITNYPISTNH